MALSATTILGFTAMRRPSLTVGQILEWADQFGKRWGAWPSLRSGPIPGTDENWRNIDAALRRGWRTLPRWTLAKMLAVHRNRRHQGDLPQLREGQIVKWADAWRKKTGRYPTRNSGLIPGLNDETWARLNTALVVGHRGLKGGSSLARLLAEYRDVRNVQARPKLTITQVLDWCDRHHRRTGMWPNEESGVIVEAPDHNWKGVSGALRRGLRGLPGGSSLARLLANRRGVRNEKALPGLSVKTIWAWAVSYHCRTGNWPNSRSGPVFGTRWEKWSGVDAALRQGKRGLRGGSSLGDLVTRKLQEKSYHPKGQRFSSPLDRSMRNPR